VLCGFGNKNIHFERYFVIARSEKKNRVQRSVSKAFTATAHYQRCGKKQKTLARLHGSEGMYGCRSLRDPAAVLNTLSGVLARQTTNIDALMSQRI
jgi:hypothetical protein